jgi:2-polyprenyl-3-methyl-5-hydroxy-6-metoxy-1,4-benzoquinol methylase
MKQTGGSLPACPLCGGEVRAREARQPGYCLGTEFRIMACGGCGAAFAEPMAVDPAIYDAIYGNPEQIAGYDRYVRYARMVLDAADPLGLLAGSEDVYWAIRACVERAGRGARILEVGSGLGYLTYALRKAGYDALGMDVSKVAVENALERYGAFYQEADLEDWSVRQAGSYDLVIMTELIEHLTDPLQFLGLAAKLLKPGGRIVLTTPNKSYYPDGAFWETDAPPVHLWWFSERSIEALARRLGLAAEFLDFAPFNREHGVPETRIANPGRPSYGALLDESRRPLPPAVLKRMEHERRPALYRLLRLRRSLARRLGALRRQLGMQAISSRRGALCAILTRS